MVVLAYLREVYDIRFKSWLVGFKTSCGSWRYRGHRGLSHISVLIFTHLREYGVIVAITLAIHGCIQCYKLEFNPSSYHILVLGLSFEYGLSDNTNCRTLSGTSHSRS